MKLATAICALSALVMLTGCEEEVDPVIGTDLPFTLYGVLTPQLDTQWVRVYPIEHVLQPATDEPLDGVLTSLDHDSGETRVWRDSLIRDRTGQLAHVSYSPFRAAYGHKYTLNIVRSDAQKTTVTTTVPDTSTIQIGRDPASNPVSVPVIVQGDVPRLMNVRVEYEVKFGISPDPLASQQRFLADYEGNQQKIGDDWYVRIDLTQDYSRIQNILVQSGRYDASYGIAILKMRVYLTVGNKEWNPPGGSFDPDVLVQPGMMDNVENGFGFLGAGYKLYSEFVPDMEDQKRAGFTEVR